MATAEQIKSLIRSHWSDDPERFFTLALQVAAHEAQQGHGALAHEIRELVDKAKRDKAKRSIPDLVPDLEGLVQSDLPLVPITALVLPGALRERIQRILQEYLQRDKLKAHGLTHRRKILLTGPPGTGKTLTARVLAHELRLPLNTVQVDKLLMKFMGETGAKLRLIFELIQKREGVYFFDEFDAIASGRDRDNDVGEMRRVLNALLQFIEQETSDSLIVAATNSPQLLDHALFRRFDDVLVYEDPDEGSRRRLIENELAGFLGPRFGWKAALTGSAGLSSAEVVQASRDSLKQAVLQDRRSVTASSLEQAFHDRRHTHPR